MSGVGYPVVLELEARAVLVAGAGRVATRKIGDLLETGVAIRVVSPAASPEIEAWAREGRLSLVRREAGTQDLEGVRLAFLATDSPPANDALEAAARERGILVNRADRPGGGDFSVPARIRRGPITVAIATGGASPRLARLLRERLEQVLDEGWGRAAEGLAAVRERVAARVEDPELRRRFWETFPGPEALAALLRGEAPTVEQEVTRCLSTLSA
jgi:siroheme synthase-like protein